MARTAIPTYVTGDLITAAHGNTYWRDNEAAHWPFTTAGDLAYASGATALSRLAIGSAKHLLQVNAGGNAPEWDTLDFEANGFFVGRVDSDGTGVDLPSGWTATRTAVGKYTLGNIPDSKDYVFVAMLAETDGVIYKRLSISATSTALEIYVKDLSGAFMDAEFMFVYILLSR